jgi:hypothetical protein
MRIALTLLLLLAAAPACAEWMKVGESDDAFIYIDPATIEKNGPIRRLWAMQEIRQIGPDGVGSIRSFEEYDCADRKFRYLSISAYAAPRAEGQVLFAHKIEDAWTYLPPDATSSKNRIVCSL